MNDEVLGKQRAIYSEQVATENSFLFEVFRVVIQSEALLGVTNEMVIERKLKEFQARSYRVENAAELLLREKARKEKLVAAAQTRPAHEILENRIDPKVLEPYIPT